jgi:ubiquinone/menaquinone biosynthesis C-methylase UbiE
MNDAIVKLIRQVCPPFLFEALKQYSQNFQQPRHGTDSRHAPLDGQDLDIYWNKDMAQLLETWGEGNVWQEIQFLLANCSGRVLDIACGTGKTIEVCSRFSDIDLYGLDISDFLIGKARDRGIPLPRLAVGDATKTPYENDFFDFAYTIGSLEHFTEKGIMDVIAECRRIVRKSSFHMVPVSKSSQNEGWIKPYQSYFNNSIDWWLEIFREKYKKIIILDSSWCDDISLGKWFVCKK